MSTAEVEALALVRRVGRVGIITLNRPEARNAVNEQLTMAMADVIDELEADDGIWVLVVTGSGDKAFCAGADLKAALHRSEAAPEETPRLPRDFGGFAGITTRTFTKPVIAAVNGFALGGGTEICLACDVIIAEEHATFGLPEVKRGIVAGAGGLERLPRRIAPALAMELILTGRSIAASRALELGLVNQVVPSGSAVDAALVLAEEICEAAPLAVRYSRAVARQSFSFGEDEAKRVDRDLRRQYMKSEDLTEGLRAFAEKRRPAWKGR